MRAGKLGRRHTPGHIAKVVATRIGKPLSPEWRQHISEAQMGKVLAADHLEAIRAAGIRRRGKALPPTTRARIAASLVIAYEEGRRAYTAPEQYAATLLLPLGFSRNPILDGHAFDFGRGDVLVEVNGCHWHDHRAIKPTCPVKMHPLAHPHDDLRRSIAQLHNCQLVDLWQCEKRDWPTQLAHR